MRSRPEQETFGCWCMRTQETTQAARLGEGLGHRGGVLRGFIQDTERELRRIPLLRGWVNKGLSSLLSRLTPEPGDPSCDDCGCPYGYELAYSVPCANPHQHLPKEAPRVQDAPVHVALHVTPKARVLPQLQVCVA